MNNTKDSMSIARQVLELEGMPSSNLRKIYNNLFQDKCSSNANCNYLRPKIAYRLQELAIGGLDEQTKAKLDNLAKGVTIVSKAKNSDLLVGTKICKEYNSCLHEVEVIKDGFEYMGQKWKSLSAIATKITGAKWSGPKFFGLRG